ncbi:flagellar hook-associated protein FlgK [Effusibacillus dendaii]|uniref:Flagellar hook-associated protein 1 n=1 Tax=Effusibacillus dendaii TaxID=2743772 RepID=A0A7I8DCP4_9BACL|nr:flagellar hook-associated protein FlgK [Effusibacillus dendaii]BCJ87864.1 flagellar hook-associated protein 1 [Effusibacillus dendaii]
MRSTFHGLEVAKRGLFAQQTALNTVSHNVANANTEGYSRQAVDMTTFEPLQYPAVTKGTEAGQLGQGVDVVQIQRLRDRFLDSQYRRENSSLSEWNIKSQTLDKLQIIMNAPSDTGLATVLTNFFNAWHDLSVAPDNPTSRELVKQRGLELVGTLNLMNNQLSNLDTDLISNINTEVNQVNSFLGQIQQLNKQINMVETTGTDKANDLRDRRDLLVDQLSKFMDVQVTESANGMYSITTGGTPGTTLLDINNNTASVAYDPVANGINVTGPAAAGTTAVTLVGGEIKGLIDSRTTYVASYKRQLDAFVEGLAEGSFTITKPDGTTATYAGVNGLHQAGYTLHDPTLTGIPFFTKPAGASTFTAANIQVNSQIVSDVKYIAASDSSYTDASGTHVYVGNGTNALLLGQVANQTVAFTTPGATVPQGTPGEYLRSLVGKLGLQAQEASRYKGNQDTVVQQVNNQRQSVSGVSIDEEMANMIKFQQAYNASARMVTVIDSILDRIINGMGLTR